MIGDAINPINEARLVNDYYLNRESIQNRMTFAKGRMKAFNSEPLDLVAESIHFCLKNWLSRV